MSPCYVKTDAGREEIGHPTRKFSRAARNLLLILDDKHPGSNWVQLVHGATEADLQQLLSLGLIIYKQDAAPGLQLRSNRTLAEALALLSYEQLYALMTSQARDRLGLERIQKLPLAADIIIGDGGSTDGSNSPELLRGLGVRSLLIKTGPGRLSAQMRMALGVSAA